MAKTILFITTSNLSTNPRLLKEILFAKSMGFKVIIVGFNLGGWSDALDLEIVNREGLGEINYISAKRVPFSQWILSSGIEKISKNVYSLFKSCLKVAAYASNKRSYLLSRYLQKKRIHVNFVVAHNLGALYPAFNYARKLNIPFIFDVEDYHPGEVVANDQLNEKRRREQLMKALLPKCSAVTNASPLIGNAVESLCGIKSITINNSFPDCEFTYEPKKFTNGNDLMKFVWFSQNITFGRGLEILFEAIEFFSEKVELTLIGNLNKEFGETWVKDKKYVQVLAPMTQPELHLNLSNYDVGLALELSEVDLNKNLAISNKIMAYHQSGLFILATDTLGQQWYMNSHREAGILVNQNVQDLKGKIELIIKNKEGIRSSRQFRYEAAKSVAWENESQKLLDLWHQLI